MVSKYFHNHATNLRNHRTSKKRQDSDFNANSNSLLKLRKKNIPRGKVFRRLIFLHLSHANS